MHSKQALAPVAKMICFQAKTVVGTTIADALVTATIVFFTEAGAVAIHQSIIVSAIIILVSEAPATVPMTCLFPFVALATFMKSVVETRFAGNSLTQFRFTLQA